MEVKSKKLPKSQIEITFELTAEEFTHHFEHALSHMKGHVRVDGFRPGQAPDKLVEEKLKPEALLMEAGDHAVQHVYSDYIKENDLEPVGQPEVKIMKIVPTAELSRIRDAIKNGVGTKEVVFIFNVVATVLPDVELPDYKEIAKKVKSKEVSVTEDEVQDSLKYLQKTRAKFTLKNEPAEKGDFVEINYQSNNINAGNPVDDQFILGEGGFMKDFEEAIAGIKAGEEKEFKVPIAKQSRILDKIGTTFHEGMEMNFKIKLKSVQKMELPELNDEFAKQIGTFDTLSALKGSIKQGIEMEKRDSEKQRRRGEILEKVAEKTKIELPDVMIEYEKNNLMEDLKQRITQNMKISFEQYLSVVKQTEDQLKETFQKEAEKRLKGFLVLREIGRKENIEVSEKELDEEIAKSVKNFSKGLDKIDTNQLKEYTKGVLVNEKIFQILEKLS